jgi:capsular polysaccharide biosynthesis protein
MINTQAGLKRYQQGWQILIFFIATALFVSLGWMISTTPLYRASATFLVYPNESLTSSRDVVSSLDTLDKRTISSTYSDIMASNRVIQDTIERLQLDPVLMREVKIYAEVEPETNILVLHVEGPDPALITLLANNVGQNGISFIKSIYQVFDIVFLDLALEPELPFHPRPVWDNLIAAGIGLLLGLLFLILRDALRVPLESLREKSQTDRQSLAFTKKHLIRLLTQEMVKKKETPLAFSLIYLQGLEDLLDGLPDRIASDVLRNVVERLHAMLRGNDRIARWDRLVFGIMLPATPELPATKTIERLLSSLEEPITLETGDSIQLDPVAGLVLRHSEDTLDDLVDRAEKSLNQAREGIEKLSVIQ